MGKCLGIRREDKNPWERRVPLIPSHIRELIRESSLAVSLQPSPRRIFADQDYIQEGASIDEDLSPCPVIFAVKEIPVDQFLERKAYVFFSHTIKGQPYNMPMLKRMMDLKCTLIDYERIADEDGRRLIFFGTQAGQAGMIDTFWAYGQRLGQKGQKTFFADVLQAIQYSNLNEAKEAFSKLGWRIKNNGLDSSLVPLVCGFAGYGRVSQGAQEIFDLLPFEQIAPEKLLQWIKNGQYASDTLYKVVFEEKHMVTPKDSNSSFDLQDYYSSPEKYYSVFETYLPSLSILVNCIYWAPPYPRLVTKKYLKQFWREDPSPRIEVIGDISCDIEGSIECTVQATSPNQPVFIYDPFTEKIQFGVKGRGLAIMSIDNLPAEIPLESSISFSSSLLPLVPGIAQADFSGSFENYQLPPEVKKAVILFQGELTPEYKYLVKFID